MSPRRRRILPALMALVAAWLPGAQARARSEAPLTAQAILERVAAAYPGGAWMRIDQDGAVRSGAWGYGFGDLPFTPETPIALYSTTKPVTGILAARLALQGRVDLDRPVGDYVQIGGELARRPLRRLLTNSAGVRHYRPDEWLAVSTRRCAAPSEALDLFVNDPPGPEGAFVYSSYSYVLASQALSQATGTPFADLLAEEVLRPAGMIARLWEPGLRRPPNGFEMSAHGPVPARAIDNSCKSGAGALVGSAGDLARFGHAALDGMLLPREQLHKALELDPASGGAYAMGWTVLKDGEGRTIALHSGNGLGGTAVVAIDLDRGRSIGLVGNLQGPDLVETALALLGVE
ncbi:serine hydrolase domain-containing protein [Brevundimonas sp. 2R-24]|uniref:Serine hydrolase domain-containing protein n=1 Tax=Peiella sedimenti TaxID=3061083 RepID=A0ABT8SJV2_9CAUL|nr:serine hydrolase domain-containing protein [Caulobacteraceae bacterium XZ-24]